METPAPAPFKVFMTNISKRNPHSQFWRNCAAASARFDALPAWKKGILMNQYSPKDETPEAPVLSGEEISAAVLHLGKMANYWYDRYHSSSHDGDKELIAMLFRAEQAESRARYLEIRNLELVEAQDEERKRVDAAESSNQKSINAWRAAVEEIARLEGRVRELQKRADDAGKRLVLVHRAITEEREEHRP